eukprot:2488698-Rhodomonas_salina.2
MLKSCAFHREEARSRRGAESRGRSALTRCLPLPGCEPRRGSPCPCGELARGRDHARSTPPSALRACYALSGTEAGYAATRCRAVACIAWR